jgi:hypothetical protein
VIELFLMRESGPYCALTHVVFRMVWAPLNPETYAQTDADLIEHQALREDKVREEIARRLSRVRGNFSDHDFQTLVSLMAERQLLDERRQRW